MSDEEQKKSIHFHLGGVIVLILFIAVLFNVDMKKTINNPKFQANITYIENKAEDLWKQYLSKPVLYIWNNLFSDLISKGINQVKEKALKQVPTNINQFNLGGMQGEKSTSGQ